jgi:hypothetical protein
VHEWSLVNKLEMLCLGSEGKGLDAGVEPDGVSAEGGPHTDLCTEDNCGVERDN